MISAEAGIANSAVMLGIAYGEGDSVTKAAAEAIKWFEKAKTLGYSATEANISIRNLKAGRDLHTAEPIISKILRKLFH